LTSRFSHHKNIFNQKTGVFIMKNAIFLSLVSLAFAGQLFAQTETVTFDPSTPIQPAEVSRPTLLEIGLVFPIFSDDARNFINGAGIAPNPLSTGFGTGVQFGYHKQMSDRATLGVVANTTMYLDNGATTTQLYQLGAFATGRLYFMEKWTNSVFAEVGAGPEVAAYSINGGTFTTQASLASRFGAGYNYSFDNNVCLTVSAVVSPNFASNDPTRNAKIIIGMVW
jgi:hypothetical protein